jgi:hypothetical protein
LVNNPQYIEISEKPYDWLGHGFYFWENNIQRAIEWADDKFRKGLIHQPSVVGAVITFTGAGILEKNHIQICVRNLNSIKGFFVPRVETDFIKWNINKYLPTPSDDVNVLA